MHGLTHRMPGRACTPAGLIIRAHVFARGQGEFLQAATPPTRSDAWTRGRGLPARRPRRRRLARSSRPAWLLSPAARQVVDRAGFEFYEVFGGIVPARAAPPACVPGA